MDEAVPLGGRVTDWLALRMCWPSHKIAIYMLSGVSERRGGTAMLKAGVPPQALVSEDGLKRREKVTQLTFVSAARRRPAPTPPSTGR